jgi:vesicular inhibitory amino acid transporter
MDITRFGASTVFLLLTAGLIKNVVQNLIHIGICSWIPIVGALLTPIIWCGSPADFWPVAYIAMISTVIGSILLIINIIIESPDHFPSATYSAPSFKSFFLSFGNILFAFGGASAFPNFQNDMREKEKFPKAVTFGFLGENF